METEGRLGQAQGTHVVSRAAAVRGQTCGHLPHEVHPRPHSVLQGVLAPCGGSAGGTRGSGVGDSAPARLWEPPRPCT